MSTLEQALTDYLQVRRALGYQLKVHGKLLPQFLAYLKEQEQETITTEYALAWAETVRSSVCEVGVVGWC
jgi:integrase/recombinase XerD